MRPLIIAICLALPGAAYAQDEIPDPALRQVYEDCLPTCEETRSYAFCSRTCACVVDEIGTHWTMAEFRDQGGLLSRDASNREVRDQMGRIAAYCARGAE